MELELNNKKTLCTMVILNSDSSKERGRSFGRMMELHTKVISLKDSCKVKESLYSRMERSILDNGINRKCTELASCFILMGLNTLETTRTVRRVDTVRWSILMERSSKVSGKMANKMVQEES